VTSVKHIYFPYIKMVHLKTFELWFLIAKFFQAHHGILLLENDKQLSNKDEEMDSYLKFFNSRYGTIDIYLSFLNLNNMQILSQVSANTMIFCRELYNPKWQLMAKGATNFYEGKIWFAPKPKNESLEEIHSMLPLRLDSDFVLWSVDEDDSSKITLEEIYKIKDTIKVHKVMGSVDLRLKEATMVLGKWERRADLHGIELIDSMKPWTFVNYPDGSGGYDGTTGTILKELAKAANFTVNHRTPRDGYYGAVIPLVGPNNTIKYINTGMIADLVDKVADLSSTSLIYTPTLREIMDISPTIDRVRMTLLVNSKAVELCSNRVVQNGDNLGFGVYSNAFTLSFWLLFSLLSLVMTFILFLWFKLENTSMSKMSSIMSSSSIYFLAMVQKNNDFLFESPGSRIVVMLVYSTTFFFYLHYAAGFTAAFLVEKVSQDPLSLEELLHGHYKLWVGNGTAFAQRLRAAKPGSVERDLLRKDIVIFATQKEMRASISQSPCSVVGYGSASYSKYFNNFINGVPNFKQNHYPSYGLHFQKNSEFTKLITYLMVKFKQSGIVKRILEKWKFKEEIKQEKEVWTPVGPQSLSIPTIICSFGIFISIFIVCLEYFYSFYKTKTHKGAHSFRRGTEKYESILNKNNKIGKITTLK